MSVFSQGDFREVTNIRHRTGSRVHPRFCVLLADGSWGSAVQGARQLGLRGVTVLVACVGQGATIVGSSRFCAEARDIEHSGARSFCEAVIEWLRCLPSEGSPVPVIPLSDRMVEYLDHGRDLFPDRFRLAVPERSLVATLISKEHSLAKAQEAGLDVPPWAVVRGFRDLQSVVSKLVFPLIVRPTDWSSAGSVYFKLFVARDQAHFLRDAGRALERGATLLVQEYISAPESSVVFGLVWRSADARLSSVCTGVKRRQAKPEGGVMAWGVAQDDGEVRAMTMRLVEHLDFTGLGGTEFIRANGRLWFVEFNPRPEAIHFLADAAGQPLMWALYKDLCGDDVGGLPMQEPAAVWIGAAWLQRLIERPRDVVVWLVDRVAYICSISHRDALLSLSDPVPFLATVRRLARGAVQQRKNHLS